MNTGKCTMVGSALVRQKLAELERIVESKDITDLAEAFESGIAQGSIIALRWCLELDPTELEKNAEVIE